MEARSDHNAVCVDGGWLKTHEDSLSQVFRHKEPHVRGSSERCKNLGRTFAPFPEQTRLVRKRRIGGRRFHTPAVDYPRSIKDGLSGGLQRIRSRGPSVSGWCSQAYGPGSSAEPLSEQRNGWSCIVV